MSRCKRGDEIKDLHIDEAEIKFGINAIGEMGSIAIGKVGVGVNYEVTLKDEQSFLEHGVARISRRGIS